MAEGEISVEQMAQELERDDRWLKEHMEEIVQKYRHKVIAILDQRIVAVGDSYGEVDDQVQREFPGRVPMLFEVPGPEDLDFVLQTL